MESPDAYEEISRLIDHAVLRPDASWEELEAGCHLAVRYRVATICLLPYFVPRAAMLLDTLDGGGHGVLVGTTIGFPHGAHATATKVFESQRAVRDGARELDMVVNRSLVKSRRWNETRDDIRAVVEAGHEAGCRVKVIFETSELEGDEIQRLCEVCNEIGPDWIKTSTGFASRGASLDAVELMRRAAAPRVQIKASGGIRSLDDLLAYRGAGATRIGTSSTAAILDDHRRRLGLPSLSADRAVPGSHY